VIGVALALALVAAAAGSGEERVRLVRVPDGGIQPEVVVDSRGTLELLSFRGDPAGGDLFVAASSDGGATFGPARRANGDASRAIAVGTVRGARLALGRDDALHVAWMGSERAQPRAPGKATPLLYSRAARDAAFEPPRNVITQAVGLDGGFDVAADGRGRVALVWHAPERAHDPDADETARRVWLAASDDDGKTLAPERPVDAPRHGACACCGMVARFAHPADAKDERLVVLYRCARETKHRDLHALELAADDLASARGGAARSRELAEWPATSCMMSTAGLATDPRGGAVAAWETKGQVFFEALDDTASASAPRPAPGASDARKHPRLAVNAKGERLLCWTEGTGWERGGALAWQLFGADGKPVAGGAGRVDGVPAWSFGTPLALRDGNFTLYY
jgi:hypothetical protein